MEKKNKKDKKFLNKKHKRSHSKDDINPNPKNNSSQSLRSSFNKKNNKNPPKRNLEPVELMYQKAKQAYENFSLNFDLDRIDLSLKANKDKKWTHDILATGTFEDKISSLVLYIKKNPKETLKYLEMLIKMAENKNRRKTESLILAIKDLFLENILNGRKYLPFNLAFRTTLQGEGAEIPDSKLINCYYDDKIHVLYMKLISILEHNINNEPLTQIKKKNMDILFEMLSRQPEGEEKILSCLINKLGDPTMEVTNYAIKLLKKLQEAHMRMSSVIFNNVKAFYTAANKPNAKLYSLVFLTQMAIPFKFPTFIEESIKFFFELFNKFSNDENSANKEEENTERYLSLIVKRINVLFKYVKQQGNQMDKIKASINEKLSTLFRLSHKKSLKLSVEILKLLFGIINTQDEAFGDRYYKSLYDLIANINLSSSKVAKDALKLIMLSLVYDNKLSRVCSFIKRLLEMSLHSEPQYIICILIIISQVIRNKNKLWKLIDKDRDIKENLFDNTKRDPQFANGENSFLNELLLLSQHYHPSVQRMAQFILTNYNKDIINYEGDPLVDFSLVNFLEKFILKNPKIKKEKKTKKTKDKEEDEDEALKRFMQEDEEEKETTKKEKEENIGEDDLAFIDKFNKVYPKITNSKNYLKKIKKKEKKEEEDVINDQEENDELNNYADKVIEDEYKKLDKDVDDDEVEGLGSVEEDEGNEEEGKEIDNEDEEGDFFDGDGNFEEEENEEEPEEEDEDLEEESNDNK